MGKEKRSKKQSEQEKSHKITDFDDEVILPPDLQAVWDFAVNSANLYDMDRKGLKKMNPVLKDMIEHKKITLRIQDGKIIKIKKAYMDEEKENEQK